MRTCIAIGCLLAAAWLLPAQRVGAQPPAPAPEAASDAAVSNAALFAALELGRPGLETVRAAVEKDDLAGAKTALAAYFRSRTHPVDPEAPIRPVRRDPAFDTSRADDLVAGRFSQWPYPGVTVDFAKGTNWTLMPVPDPEWPRILNRHHQWAELGEAYVNTSDEKYARAFNDDLIHWVRFAAVPKSSEAPSLTWQTIEAGIRLGQTWLPAYHDFLSSPSFTDEARILFYKSVLEHARFLRANPSDVNWLLMEMNGLAHAGVMFPEFRESADWRAYAYNRLAQEMERQVYPDGAHYELSPLYHEVSLRNFRYPLRLAEANGIALPEGYRNGLEKMLVFVMYMTKPNGQRPAFNDTDPGLGTRAQTPSNRVLREGADLFGREDFRFVATHGAKGTPPAQTSYAFPYAELFVMRSGWDKDARYLAFDAGPYGANHQHEDKLSFELAAFDRTLAVDPGRGAYTEGPFRSFFLSTAAHNTVMVDGHGQNRRAGGAKRPRVVSEPLPHDWSTSPGADYAEGIYDEGYGPNRIPVTHRRRILFVRPDYWLVADRLEGEARHKVESLLHFNRGLLEVRKGTGEVRTSSPDGANLAVRPLSDAPLSVSVISGQTDPVQGWIAPEYDQRASAPVAVFSAETAMPFGMGMTLYPTAAGAQPAAVTRLDVREAGRRSPAADAVACRIQGGNRADDVYLDNGAEPALRVFGGHATDGRAAIVRRAGGALLSATLLRGATLKVAGQPLISLESPAPACDLTWEGDTLRIAAPDAVGIVALRDATTVIREGKTHAAPPGAEFVRLDVQGAVRFITGGP